MARLVGHMKSRCYDKPTAAGQDAADGLMRIIP
ncbi:hypothetical protein Mal52_34300 [Symmachiella dynata]|uniref:Uncharacterized protein n=1 Tax=Symmachiella dynata TaxID=2527995 RepID=A0A517ZR31_9PLAN|nr:hypothetical protein Mal52_34300 [Symmachiella dynata]